MRKYSSSGANPVLLFNMSEALKAQLAVVDTARSGDALVGVIPSPYQAFADKSTVGPYNPHLFPSHTKSRVKDMLKDPSQVMVVTCGRDEHGRGNLGPILNYVIERAGDRNVLYVDADSTDHSVAAARDSGVATVVRREMLPDIVNRKQLAEVLAIHPATLEGKKVPGDPTLRKGIEVFLARAEALRRRIRDGYTPDYMAFIDSDLKSIPGGVVTQALEAKDPGSIYYPLEIMAAGMLDFNAHSKRGKNHWGIFTGSPDRNNESIFALYNTYAVKAKSPFLHEDQRAIAEAFFVLPGTLVHPLSGEVMIKTSQELGAMGATGTNVETARILTLAGQQLEAFGTIDPLVLQDTHPLVGNVRRGTQQRIDEPQLYKKEFWMIAGVIPQFTVAVIDYSIQTRRLPQDFDLEDYARINDWLSRIKDMSQLNPETQTREFYRTPMERIIPPVTLLHREGLLAA